MTERVAFYSAQDESVNFVSANGAEARYVHRPGADYAIIYVSSHTGCNQACRMCHLTQTGQTVMVALNIQGYVEQVKQVIAHYDSLPTAKKAGITHFHVNFMARGEPLLNCVVTDHWAQLAEAIAKVVLLPVKFNISTILPKNFHHTSLGVMLAQTPDKHRPTLYYSAYSANPDFRRKWLPRALPLEHALDILAVAQIFYDLKVVIHHALIEGENDSFEDATALGQAIDKAKLAARFNLVRYNPYSDVQGKEPPEEVVDRYFLAMIPYMVVGGSRIVPRVGRDVYASCGQFVDLSRES